MSKFIRITDAQGKTVLQEVSTIHHIEDGRIWVKDPISGLAGIEIKSTLEEIEAQLLRDEFAMAALNATIIGLNSIVENYEHHGWSDQELANESYRIADAMLKERSK